MAWPFYLFWQLVPPPQPPQGTGGHFSPLSFLNTHNDLKCMQTGTPHLDQGGGWGVCSGALSTPLVAVCVCLWPFFLRDWPFYGPFMALLWPFYCPFMAYMALLFRMALLHKVALLIAPLMALLWPFYGPFMVLVSWPFYSRRLFCLPLTSSLGVFFFKKGELKAASRASCRAWW